MASALLRALALILAVQPCRTDDLLTNFLAAGNLAAHLKAPLHAAPLTLPTELHVLFIGFSGHL